MDFYVATKLDKFIKKNVATFLTHVTTLIKNMVMKLMSQHLTTLSRHKELKIAEKLCRDKRQLCRDTKSILRFEGQENSVTIDKFYVTIENSRTMRKIKTKGL